MALSTENANLVWQKVKMALMNANPASQNAFLDLKMYLATQKKNPDLQFISYTAEQAIVDGGTDMVGAASTLYGWYANGRRTTGTTSAFLALHAAATSNATTTTLVTARFKAIGQSFAALFPAGLAAETGLTISAATAVGGATESATADAADGFVIVGA